MASRTAIHSDLISRCVRSEAYAQATQTGCGGEACVITPFFLPAARPPPHPAFGEPKRATQPQAEEKPQIAITLTTGSTLASIPPFPPKRHHQPENNVP